MLRVTLKDGSTREVAFDSACELHVRSDVGGVSAWSDVVKVEYPVGAAEVVPEVEEPVAAAPEPEPVPSAPEPPAESQAAKPARKPRS